MNEQLRIKAFGFVKINKKQFFWFYGVIFVMAFIALIYFYTYPIDTSQMQAGWKKSILDNITWALWIYLFGGMWEAQFYWTKFTEAQMNIITEQKAIIEQHKEEVEAQRDEIETQRDMIVEQNKLLETEKLKIEQSIQYAKRIQKALLQNTILEKSDFLDYFLFFRPRDQVSGDFYWTYQSQTKLYIVISDCTGHGVPGAFLSVLGVAYLNDIVKEYPNFSAAEILNELRNKIINALHQQDQNSERKEGMDMALLIIKDKSKAQFSGANQELISYTNNTLTVIKGNRMPIGIHRRGIHAFTNHEFNLVENMSIYLYSDGYIDQVGRKNHRKYMRKNFRQFTGALANLPTSEQGKKLAKEFDTFKENLPQVDDVSVLGIKIKAKQK